MGGRAVSFDHQRANYAMLFFDRIYDGQPYCVPLEATHTAMLMDLAVVLRNLNVQPTDLNVPATVRLAE
jgi:hypothetical protein